MITDSHSILARRWKHFSLLLNVHWVNDGRQTEIHTKKSLVPEHIAFQVEMIIEMIKGHKSAGIDHIHAELIQAGSRIFRCEIHKLIISIWKERACRSSGRSPSLYLFIRREIKQL